MERWRNSQIMEETCEKRDWAVCHSVKSQFALPLATLFDSSSFPHHPTTPCPHSHFTAFVASFHLQRCSSFSYFKHQLYSFFMLFAPVPTTKWLFPLGFPFSTGLIFHSHFSNYIERIVAQCCVWLWSMMCTHDEMSSFMLPPERLCWRNVSLWQKTWSLLHDFKHRQC